MDTFTIIFIISLVIYLIVGGAIARIQYVEDNADFVSQALLSAFWPMALIAAPFLIRNSSLVLIYLYPFVFPR